MSTPKSVVTARVLRERVESLRAWCCSRIQQCRRDEVKLSLSTSLEAAAERIALTSVLEQLGFEAPPARREGPGSGDAPRSGSAAFAWIEAAVLHARTLAFGRRLDAARRVIESVLDRTPDCAVSWSGGKDSTALTHLVCVDRGARVRVYSEKDDLDYPGEEAYVTALGHAWDLDLEILRPPISPKEWVAEHAHEVGPGGEVHARSAGLSKACFYKVMEAANARHDCSILGLRGEESAIRTRVRRTKGLYYQLADGHWRAIPLGDWRALDVYAYAVSRGIELLPVYRCIGFTHAHEPWLIRKSWWLPGIHAAYGGIAWLRRYYPSLYRQLCEWMPGASTLT